MLDYVVMKEYLPRIVIEEYGMYYKQNIYRNLSKKQENNKLVPDKRASHYHSLMSMQEIKELEKDCDNVGLDLMYIAFSTDLDKEKLNELVSGSYGYNKN